MRVPTELWVKALIRRAMAGNAMAAVVRHGDDTAGAVFVKINRLDGSAVLMGPAPAGMWEPAEDRQLVALLDANGTREAEVDSYLNRQAEFDPDLWVIEIEDKAGRSFLEN